MEGTAKHISTSYNPQLSVFPTQLPLYQASKLPAVTVVPPDTGSVTEKSEWKETVSQLIMVKNILALKIL